MPILSSTEPAQEIVRCIEHSDTLHLGFPGQSRLTIARRDTIWVGGEQFWEAWCSGPYPTNGFHRQAFDRAKEHGELYVYRMLEEASAEHSPGKASAAGARSGSAAAARSP